MEKAIQIYRDADFKAIEGIKVDLDKTLTSADKAKLDRILQDAIEKKQQALRAYREEVKDNILKQARDATDWKKLKKKLVTLVAKQEAELKAAKHELSMTGFQESGSLIGMSRQYNHGFGGYEDVLSEEDIPKEVQDRVKAISKKVDLAVAMIDDMHSKVHKLRTKLMLSSTYRDAVTIMDFVLGNHDDILTG